MKKILIVLISFFIFNTNAYALKINSIDIKVNIDESGNALVSEIWSVEKQDVTFVEKEFYDVKNVKITDYKITDKNKTNFKEVKKWDKNKENIYYLKDSGNKKSLLFTTDGKENTFTIDYKVNGMINKFSDIYGINWYFLVNDKKNKVENINISIKGPVSYNETNVALYAIGNNLQAFFKDGEIHLSSSKITGKSQIKLMTTFTDLEYKDALLVDKSFNEVYENSLDGISFFDEMINKVTDETIKTLIFVAILIVVIVIISKIVSLFKTHDEYYGIESSSNEELPKLDQAIYYDAVPCNKDLYKIAFIGGYYKIIKNRSNLIGAILLKWIYEEKVELILNKTKPSLKLLENKVYDNKLEEDLYNLLIASANNNTVDNTKLSRYANQYSENVMNWFNECIDTVIEEEKVNGNIKKHKKNLVLDKKVFEIAKQILGLKKYLLNFNQVPRQTELTRERYKYLLICAELFGIGESVGKEILRKNPDNEMAKILVNFQTIRSIYKNIYSLTLVSYKQSLKSKKKTKNK